MINIAREFDDKTIEAMARLAERDGFKERAAALRAVIEKREKDRKELEEWLANGGMYR